jgi:hypothetical protein
MIPFHHRPIFVLPTGLEPVTPMLKAWYSSQLSYESVFVPAIGLEPMNPKEVIYSHPQLPLYDTGLYKIDESESLRVWKSPQLRI